MTSFFIRWWLIWNEFITGLILFHLSTDILQHFIFHNSTINVVARRGLIIMLNDAKMFTIHNEYTRKHKYIRITMYVIVCVRKSRHPSSILLCVISNGRKKRHIRLFFHSMYVFEFVLFFDVLCIVRIDTGALKRLSFHAVVGNIFRFIARIWHPLYAFSSNLYDQSMTRYHCPWHMRPIN